MNGDGCTLGGGSALVTFSAYGGWRVAVFQREQRLAEIFVELADSLVDDFDVIEFLQIVAARCVELLDVAAAGLVLAELSTGGGSQ